MKNEYQKTILNVLGTKPIAYNPDLAKRLKSIKSALFLSQLLYWWKKGANPDWIYKTTFEMEEETGLTRRNQETAIKFLKKFELIKVEIAGTPPKKHFQLNLDNIISLLENEL